MNWVNQSEVFITKILNKQALIQWYEMGPLSKLIMIQHIPLNSINNHDSYFVEQMLAVIVYKSNHILSLRVLSKHFYHTTALCILFKKII